jgi:hypothetical protein
MTSKITSAIIACTFAFLVSCGSDATERNTNSPDDKSAKTGSVKNDSLNISILLDLSDRISPDIHPNSSMAYHERDLGYIESIAKAFEHHLRSKPIRNDDDHLQIYFEPEPLNPKVNDLARQLKLSFTKDNAKIENIKAIATRYRTLSTEIYKLALDNKTYIGSDIWGFFKNKATDYCIKPRHRNILFILTDGYMYHQNSKFRQGNKTSYIAPQLIATNKLNTPSYAELIQKKGYGFVKANDDLTGLEVVVLGINPSKGNPFEGDVLKEYWVNWLTEMRVKKPVTSPIAADLPSNLDQIIQRYINR